MKYWSGNQGSFFTSLQKVLGFIADIWERNFFKLGHGKVNGFLSFWLACKPLTPSERFRLEDMTFSEVRDEFGRKMCAKITTELNTIPFYGRKKKFLVLRRRSNVFHSFVVEMLAWLRTLSWLRPSVMVLEIIFQGSDDDINFIPFRTFFASLSSSLERERTKERKGPLGDIWRWKSWQLARFFCLVFKSRSAGVSLRCISNEKLEHRVLIANPWVKKKIHAWFTDSAWLKVVLTLHLIEICNLSCTLDLIEPEINHSLQINVLDAINATFITVWACFILRCVFDFHFL